MKICGIRWGGLKRSLRANKLSEKDVLVGDCKAYLACIKGKEAKDPKKTRNMFDNICKKSKPLFKGMTNPNPFGQYIASALENSADNKGNISWSYFEESLRGSLSFIKDEKVKEWLVQVGNSCVPRHNCA